jgi:glycosyltransferase involved in cell wall biosynthesis
VQREHRLGLYIVGDTQENPAYAQELAELVKRLGLSYVHFLGWRQDRLELLRLMDIFVLPSLSEDAPRSIMEAMALGVPVVATRVGGIPSMLDDTATGLMVEPRDPPALAGALLKLASEPELRREMGQRARVTARERYSVRRTVAETQNLYTTLLLQERSIDPQRVAA